MKILHLSSARTWRGGEQQIAYLIEELQLKGVEQHVFCVQDGVFADWCEKNQIPNTTYEKRSSISLKIAKSLKRLCQDQAIQLIHAHDSHAHTYSFLSSWLFRNSTPIIVSRRVDFPVSKSVFSKWKYNHHRIKYFICISEKIKAVLSPSIKDQAKLQVVHSGVDVNKFDEFDPQQQILREEFDLPSTHKLVANIAAIAPHKDYFTFVDTVAVLVNKDAKIHFFIIGGDGGEQAEIKQYIKSKKLEHAITLTGFRIDIPEIFPELDLLLFTSKEEGLGTTILDAFAAKVPVVATAAGGIPEMITHQVNGMLAPIGDSLQLSKYVEQVLNDALLQKQFIQAATFKLSDFRKERMAEKVLEIYRKVCE